MPDPAPATTSELIFQFVLLGILLLCSALISGSEVAYFSLKPSDKEELKQQDSKVNKMVINQLDRPKRLLATILVYNNFVNVAIVILSSTIVGTFISNHPRNATLKFFVEIFGITLVLLLLGEVIPKIYASQKTKNFARMMARPLDILQKLPPFNWIILALVKSTNVIQRRAKRKGIKISSDELEAALALTKEDSTSEEEHKLLEGIVKFGNTEVRQIMKPRMDVIALDYEMSYDRVLELILESGYSRIPVYEKSFDNIKGLLFIKDLIPNLNKSADFRWQELMRKPFFVPEKKKIDDLLKEFQEKKVHMAMIVDEYGGTSGIATLEDILEEIVGDITDEFDEEEIVYTKIDDKTYLFEGRTSLVDFIKVTGADSKEIDLVKGESETLSGFLIEQAGRILRNNEHVTCGSIKFIVESSDVKRIKMIKTILQ